MITGIAISNIAWEPDEDRQVVALLRRFDIRGLEIAPAKVNPVPAEASRAQISGYRTYWEDLGVELVAMQALLFGAPYLAIFEGDALREAMYDQLSRVIDMAGQLGIRRLVFGSPKNRMKGDLSLQDAIDSAAPFFRRLGALATDHGAQLCIEPNPAYYGCDFITTSEQGMALVDAVDHPGFGLHLDAAGLTLAGEDIHSAIVNAEGSFSHFHISEQDLAPIGSGSVDHAAVAGALEASGYSGWASIEMRPPGKDGLATIERALKMVTDTYGRLLAGVPTREQ